MTEKEPGTCGLPCPEHGDPCSIVTELEADEAEVAAAFTGKSVEEARRAARMHTEHLCFKAPKTATNPEGMHRWVAQSTRKGWIPLSDRNGQPRRAPDVGPRAWRLKHTDRCEHGRFISGTWLIRDLGRNGNPTPEDWSDSHLEEMSQACRKCTPTDDE